MPNDFAGNDSAAIEREPTADDVSDEAAGGIRRMTPEEREDRRARVRAKFAAGELVTLAEFRKRRGL
jgi:hypothetical protein